MAVKWCWVPTRGGDGYWLVSNGKSKASCDDSELETTKREMEEESYVDDIRTLNCIVGNNDYSV